MSAKPRFRVKARRAVEPVLLRQDGMDPIVAETLREMTKIGEREGAQGVAIAFINRGGYVSTAWNTGPGGSVHALAGGVMNLLYRLQHEGMEWE